MTWDWATEWYDYVMIRAWNAGRVNGAAVWRAEFHLIGFSYGN